jgi:hypothetical protein
MCPDDDETHSEWTRDIDGFEIRVVRERPKCACGCPDPKEDSADGLPPEGKGANPEPPCYENHYLGKCECNCGDCSDCDCRCILLARLDREGDTGEWSVDHRVRRFIRPVLMHDPKVQGKQKVEKDQEATSPIVIEEHALKEDPRP